MSLPNHINPRDLDVHATTRVRNLDAMDISDLERGWKAHGDKFESYGAYLRDGVDCSLCNGGCT